MSEFLGSRISLISKSDIRYVGTLHEINSDESTVSLENVRSFGTEGRRGRPEEEISPSDQVYEYIVFRGSDVKDLRIEEHPAIKETKPPAMPDDPAIVGARTRDVQQPQSSSGGFQPPYPPQNGPYGGPLPHYSWGRGGGPGPMPGPGFAGVPYPPPPGWLPPGQGYPSGPGPWSNPQFPSGPGGPTGPDVAQRGPPSVPSQDAKSGSGGDQAKTSTPVLAEPKSLAQAGRQTLNGPNLPVDSKPSVEEVKAVATNLSNGPTPNKSKASTRPTPAVPLMGNAPKPFQLPNTGKPAPPASVRAPPTSAPPSVEDATSAARAAVAVAMAQLGNSGSTAMDNLTNKVNEMRVHANRGASGGRGRGRGGRQGFAKVEVPDSDFDFAQSNAKFNKEDIVKEAIASGDVVESISEPVIKETETHPGSSDTTGSYNKSRSFFDNISSESRERAENGGQKPGGREWRGEEQRKNMETFGQGSVDGGYRNYRGRGRGRGGRGRGGFGRGGRGGNRPQYSATVADHQ
ncbi:ribonucleoprotein (LSM)-related domain protein [Metarhizium album ARSEF 1941]|uniref:Ribonucleoprotein (LSM)-related domain protein n=1 Tax=Metarhizium album (strain ARSEF 1941) TaxID=1081103 RepID=A0A0B2X0L2_METAS|nr:ribonucleoprotein (LSM)-related domain protein [Metarhizium album ARSEF 1941]KHN99202.1 ribonucleoprotein (LSM)-related domain protein [Metarhizium album ARSEF 1941]